MLWQWQVNYSWFTVYIPVGPPLQSLYKILHYISRRSKCTETKLLLQGSNRWHPHVLNQQLHLFVKDSCIVFILFLCYIQQLLILVVVLHSPWIFLLVCSLSIPCPFMGTKTLIDWALWNNATSSTMYNHLSDTNIIYRFNPVHGKQLYKWSCRP